MPAAYESPSMKCWRPRFRAGMRSPRARLRLAPCRLRPGIGTSAVRATAAAGLWSDEGRRCEFLGDCLSALRAKPQDDRLTIGRDIRFEQRRRSARAIEPRIALASSAYGAARDKLDHGRGCELPRLKVRCKILADAPADVGPRIREPSQPARLAQLPHVVPLRVIAVLQAASGVTPDSLEMGGRIRRVEHVLVGRRHGQAGEAADDP